jgi:hypothetical protein
MADAPHKCLLKEDRKPCTRNGGTPVCGRAAAEEWVRWVPRLSHRLPEIRAWHTRRTAPSIEFGAASATVNGNYALSCGARGPRSAGSREAKSGSVQRSALRDQPMFRPMGAAATPGLKRAIIAPDIWTFALLRI